MKLLLSNDDGVTAPGLVTLASCLSEIADVRVIAPDRDRSGASNSLTLHKPLYLNHLDNGFVSVNGTPTDCVYLGVTGVLDFEPDMVVSGINAGANLGDDVLYSGTVAAAMEGRFLGMPAIALSLVSKQFVHLDTAGFIARRLVESRINLRLPPRTILNVNVPDLAVNELKGIQLTRLGHRARTSGATKLTDPRGRACYWIAVAGQGEDAGPGTDFYAVSQGYVSVTPLQVDMTRYEAFEPLTAWLAGIL